MVAVIYVLIWAIRNDGHSDDESTEGLFRMKDEGPPQDRDTDRP